MAHYSDIYHQEKAYHKVEIAQEKLEKLRTKLSVAKYGDVDIPYILEDIKTAGLELEQARKDYQEWLR